MTDIAARAIAPEFEVQDVTWVREAAAPMLSFAIGVTETSGREVFTIAQPAVRSRAGSSLAMRMSWGSLATGLVGSGRKEGVGAYRAGACRGAYLHLRSRRRAGDKPRHEPPGHHVPCAAPRRRP